MSRFDLKRLREPIAGSTMAMEPIALLVKDGVYYRIHRLDYHGGAKYPHVVRDESKPDILSDIVRPHATR